MLLDRDPRSVRIERLMAERSRSFRWLAEKLGTSHVSVRKWILGEAKPRDDAVWRQMLDLLEESGIVSHVDNLLARGFALTAAVPSWLGARASLDPMDEEEFEQDDAPYEIPTAFLVGGDRKIDRHMVARVAGMSMSPRIVSGDRVIIFMDQVLFPDSIVLAESPDRQVFLKALRFDSKARRYELHSLAHDGQRFEDLDGWKIIGYAVAILGDQDGRNVEWRMGAHLRA